ncbi:hypothetical protein RF11_10803 [Thelohanellus kitauei]|uniref:Uncharacterized protein n=1 Tax=Thelohanellus kitauei TaxID=669202 RepID=A0A0C2MMJ1_THEKT|nr:hypothetical protein RF11_10803 [Thelohanellus kitauei]
MKEKTDKEYMLCGEVESLQLNLPDNENEIMAKIILAVVKGQQAECERVLATYPTMINHCDPFYGVRGAHSFLACKRFLDTDTTSLGCSVQTYRYDQHPDSTECGCQLPMCNQIHDPACI